MESPRSRPSLAFVGATAAGKTTLINGLLKTNLLPTGRGHCVDRIVALQYGDTICVEAPDSATREFGPEVTPEVVAAVTQYIRDVTALSDTEHTPEEIAAWASVRVTVYAPLPILRSMDMYDIPDLRTRELLTTPLSNLVHERDPYFVFVWRNMDLITGQDAAALRYYHDVLVQCGRRTSKIFFAANGVDIAETCDDDDYGSEAELAVQVFRATEENERERFAILAQLDIVADILLDTLSTLDDVLCSVSARDAAGRSARTARIAGSTFDRFRQRLYRHVTREEAAKELAATTARLTAVVRHLEQLAMIR